MTTNTILFKTIDELHPALTAMSDQIFDNPELGNMEFKAHKLVTKFLHQHGFQIESNLLGLETAFRATYSVGTGGPRIGLLCEYDALKELGHACAHHMQSPAIIGAALAIKEVMTDRPYTLLIYGTPAEETTSGKIPMAKNGLFDDLDVALMMHGSDTTTVDGKSLAVNLVDFVFHGKSSHAAIAPEKGISALDAVLLTFNGIEYLREHVRDDVRMHGIITDGGKAANIVPARAAAQFYIRADDRPYLDTVLERAYNVARGSALSIGATLEINEIKAYDNKFNVPSLNKLLLAHAETAGAEGISPPREKTGSTDFSCVTYRVPGACLRVKFVPKGTPSHSTEWINTGKAPDAHNAIIIAARALALTGISLITDSALLTQIKEEFQAAKQRLANP